LPSGVLTASTITALRIGRVCTHLTGDASPERGVVGEPMDGHRATRETGRP
jgi:hypothetical protein